MRKIFLYAPVFLILALLLMFLQGGCNRVNSATGVSERIVIGLDQEPLVLNPYIPEGTSMATKLVTSNVLWGLLSVTPDLRYVPRIVERVPTINNGLVTKNPFTVTFEIKKNAVWSDGAPITSSDVKFTWETIMNSKNCVTNRFGYDQIERIDTPHEKTVTIVFKRPYPAYNSLFTSSFPILPKHILEGKRIHEAMNDFLSFASGPYKFKEWNRGKQLVIEPNESFWGAKPKIKKVTFKFMPDRAACIAGLERGSLDLIYSQFDEQDIARLKAVRGKVTNVNKGLLWDHVGFNLSKSPLDDINVRRAVAYAIDRRKIARLATGDPHPLDSVVVAEQAFYTPAWRSYDYNVRKAKDCLLKAGYSAGSNGIYEKDGKPLTLTISMVTGNPIREKVEMLIKENLELAGIKVEIKNSTPDVFFNSCLPEGKFDIGLWGWLDSVEPDLRYRFASDKIPPAGQNYYRYSDPEINSLLNSIDTEIDASRRFDNYYKVQAKLSGDLVVIPLYRHLQALSYDKKIKGVVNNTTEEGPLYDLNKWWIIK
ncbi:MAG: peptide ABC transporter substrate-binding protein [Firmicutes bacterium]|nr:peptide ABC transporter substrate-binding protein [Bacillota bacterium]